MSIFFFFFSLFFLFFIFVGQRLDWHRRDGFSPVLFKVTSMP